MKRFWRWCERWAAGGWLLAIAVMMVTATASAMYLSYRASEVMVRCGVQ